MLAIDYGGSLAGLHRSASHAFGPVERGFSAVTSPVGNFVAGLPDVARNRHRINQLTRDNASLRADVRTAQASGQQLAQLRAIDAAAASGGYQIRAASVLDLGPSPGFEWTARIALGSPDGVRTGMTVVADGGLVGRVTQVAGDSSLVLLAADPGSSVGVRDERDREVGIATGHGLSPMSYVALDPAARPRLGDLVRTGPYGESTYAAGVPVGRVSAVRSVGGSATPQVEIAPLVDVTRLDVVGVILTAPTGTQRASGRH